MLVRFVLDCEESFKKKAAYTLDTFSQVIGLPYEISEPDNLSEDHVAVWYGKTPPKSLARIVFVPSNTGASQLFEARKPFPVSQARTFSLDDGDSIALFYDDEFAKDPSRVVSGDERFRLFHIDIVASGFYFLSCWQEFTSDHRDQHERYPAAASLQHQFGLLHTPVVNQYSELLRRELERLTGEPIGTTPRFGGRDFAFCVTHDIDYIRKWSLGIIYREFVQYFLLGRGEKSWGRRLKRLRAFLKAASARRDPYVASLERILRMERAAGIHATYFLKTGGTSKHDISYRISDGVVHRLLKQLVAGGHEIGIHPSYNSHLSASTMQEEKEKLDNAIGNKTTAVRQHFLRFSAPQTWRAQESLGVTYDSTLGFADHEGFRAALCLPFRPYDVEGEKVLNLWELPLVVMDGSLQGYRKKSPSESLEIIKKLIRVGKKYRGVIVLLFHNTCYDELDFPQWGEVFEESLRYAQEEGGFIGSGLEVVKSYLQSLD